MIRAEIPHSLVLSVSTCAPQWLVWSLCWCVVPASCFVTAFFSCFPTIFAGTRLCWDPEILLPWQRDTTGYPLFRLSVEFNNHCLAILDTNALAETNRKCLPWSWVIAKVLAPNVNLTSEKRSVLFGNLNKRSTWALGVGGGDMKCPELASWKFETQFSKDEKLIDGPAVSSMHSISLTTFFVCFCLNELSEFS